MNADSNARDMVSAIRRTKAEMIPKIPMRLRIGYGANYLCNHFLKRDKPLGTKIVGGLKDSLQPLGDDRFRELPRFRVQEITPRLFREAIRNPMPFVIEGLLDGAHVLDWDVDYLEGLIGNIEVPIHQLDADGFAEGEINRIGTFGEVLEDMRLGLGTRKYIDNVSDVFSQCPQLRRDIPVDRLKEYVGARLWGLQLFLGGKGTGSRFHCASQFNLFLMARGVKEWLFAHPRASALFQPRMNPYGIYSYCDVYDRRAPDQRAQALFERIPLLKTRLSKGDALLNPPWWWHSVRNATPQTIGISTRWEAPYLLNDNPFYSIVQFLTPYQTRLLLHMKFGEGLKDSLLKLRIRER